MQHATSTQVSGDKSIKQMLQHIMAKLEPVDEINLKLDKMFERHYTTERRCRRK